MSSDSKTPHLPSEIELPGSPSPEQQASGSAKFETPPTFAESIASPSNALLVDVETMPDDPHAHQLEVVVARSSAKVDPETQPLLGEPPEFSQYEADYFTTADGSIVSHDKHLNEDGEALNRFILEHSSTRPTFLLNCSASHSEWRTRQITRYEDGKNVTSTETYSETITDFNFTIDLSSAIIDDPAGAPIWIVGDKDAAYRGRRTLEVDSAPHIVVEGTTMDIEAGLTPCGAQKSWRRPATSSEQRASKSWKERRADYGYAPWVLIRGQMRGMEASVEPDGARARLTNATRMGEEHNGWYDDSVILPPTKNLRDWSDEYCASRRLLKEFVFEKVVYGWNLQSLKQAVETTIRNNYVYQDQPHISFSVEAATISVRPDSRLSRMLSNKWILVLLWITLIYPLFIWPFKRFGARGGGDWRVAGSAFPLTKWVHLEDSDIGESVEEYERHHASCSSEQGPRPILKATSKGVSQLVGLREGEWFGCWEQTIGSLVRQRYVSTVPLTRPLGTSRTAGIGLDGYYPDN